MDHIDTTYIELSQDMGTNILNIKFVSQYEDVYLQ